MKFRFIVSLVLMVFLLSSCQKGKTDLFDVVYEVEFVASWSASSHPTDFPSDPHFSPVMAISHTSLFEVFTNGLTATEGVKQLAETGATDIIEEEFQTAINNSIALDTEKGKRVDSPGSDKIEIGVSPESNTVTVLSMIAPSPDWFVAASTSLIDPVDGLWFDVVTVNAQSYDSGTDSGITFTSPNEVTTPQGVVNTITDGPLTEGDSVVVNMGQFIFRRIK